MKNLSHRLLAGLLALALLFSLSACGSGQALEEYRQSLISAMAGVQNDIATLSSRMNAFDGAESSLGGVTDAIDACADSCQALIDLQPPEKAKDAHARFVSGMNRYLDAMDIYRNLFSSLDDLRSEKSDSLIDTAQSYLDDGAKELAAGTELLDALE
ncbi:MAG: hypothetical protein PHD67_04515 [Oscillospiraceae bacterium]|nr:hypothetical protein [Oscillospiraceae bacterium]